MALDAKYLSDAKIEQLAEQVATYLAERGVEVRHRGMLKSLEAAGARIDKAGAVVRFPREVQERALQSAPRSFSMYAADREPGAAAGLPIPHPSGGFYTCTGTGARGYEDPESGEHRNLRIADVQLWGRLATALQNIDLCAFPTPTDVPPQTADVHSLCALLQSTGKHVWIQPHTEQTLPFLLELCSARAGGTARLKARPPAGIIACALTPFRFKAMDIEVLLQAGEYGLPVHASSLPVIGGTAPISTSGTVLIAAIEVLAMVIMTQIVHPGHPVFALATSLAMDMRSGRALKACPEAMQANAAAAAFIKRAYDLPVHTAGLSSDAGNAGGQAQVQHSLYAYMVAASGAAIIGRAGELEAAKTFSPLQLVIDEEIFAAVRRLRGLQIDFRSEQKCAAWEDILDLKAGGHFLETIHTLRHCGEAFQPRLFTDPSREAGTVRAANGLIDRARDRLHDVLAVSKAPDIAASRLEAMKQIVAEADRCCRIA